MNNGMTAGGLVVILMTLFVEITEPRPSRMEAALDASSLPELREFLGGVRLQAAAGMRRWRSVWAASARRSC